MERDQAIKSMLDLLKLMEKKKGSDLFITVGFPPAIKVDGKITPVSQTKLTADNTKAMTYAIMNDKSLKEFEATKECNFAIAPQGIGRYRVNAFMQQNRMGMVLRTIETNVPTLERLGLPEVAWLGDANWARFCMILVNTWYGTPFLFAICFIMRMSPLFTRMVNVMSFFLAAMASATSRNSLPVTGTYSPFSKALSTFCSAAVSLIFLMHYLPRYFCVCLRLGKAVFKK